jgi:hypothetical protein
VRADELQVSRTGAATSSLELRVGQAVLVGLERADGAAELFRRYGPARQPFHCSPGQPYWQRSGSDAGRSTVPLPWAVELTATR